MRRSWTPSRRGFHLRALRFGGEVAASTSPFQGEENSSVTGISSSPAYSGGGKRTLVNGVLLGVLCLLVPMSLLAGRVWFSPADIVGGSQLAGLIVTELRLPRTVLAIAVGAALGLSGAVLQGLTRNPLAEPGLLGVSMGASLGAVVAIYFGISTIATHWQLALGRSTPLLSAAEGASTGTIQITSEFCAASSAACSWRGAGFCCSGREARREQRLSL